MTGERGLTDTPAFRAQFQTPVLIGIASVLLVVKLAVLATPAVFMDEAYYWLWGQHPALSYFDHPPLNAWLLGLSSSLFGWSVLGLRAPVVLLMVGDMVLLWAFARRFAPPVEVARWFWVSMVLFLSTPIFVGVTAIALPDHALLFGLLGATYFFASFLARFEAAGEPRWRELFCGALFLGLAGLAKYNAALLGVSLILVIILVPAYRPLLGRWQLYAAAGLALLCQAPVLIWNLQNEFASFGFILGGRHQGLAVAWTGVLTYLAGIAVFLLPPLFVPIVRLYRAAARETRLARLAALASTSVFLAISLVTAVLFHWNLVAYAALLPFLAPYTGRLVLAAQAVLGAGFMAFLIVNFWVVPLAQNDSATVWAYGWPQVGAAVERAVAEEPVGFFAGTDYPTASLLAFTLRNPDVASLTPKRDQFDSWFDEAAHVGEDAIIVTDRLRGLRQLTYEQFESLDLIDTVPIERFGVLVNTFQIYRGSGFRPVAGP